MGEGPDWTVTLWLLSAIGAVITMLLGWIAFMIREDKRQNESHYQLHTTRLDKHDEKFEKVQDEIKEIQLENRETLTIMKHKFNIK